MSLPYSGVTTAYPHKHHPDEPLPPDTPKALRKEWFLDAQWTDLPVEVENDIKRLWRARKLGNDDYMTGGGKVRPVIFLDFDGVLNSRRSALALGGYNSDQLDPVAVKLVAKLVYMTDASVVVSSTWRLLYPLGELRDILSQHSFVLADRLIDVTPSLRSGHRGEEIEAWLTDNARPPYVILDDDNDMLPEQFSNFVDVDEQYGFSVCDYEDALSILRGSYEEGGDV